MSTTFVATLFNYLEDRNTPVRFSAAQDSNRDFLLQKKGFFVCIWALAEVDYIEGSCMDVDGKLLRDMSLLKAALRHIDVC